MLGVDHNKNYEDCRFLGCVIFFPRLAHIVKLGVRRGSKLPFRCTNCVVGGVTRGLGVAGNPTLWGLGKHLGKFWFLTLC